MTIKIVVNGYYRSGTTLVWSILKKSLSNDYICFFEPLQEEIAVSIQREKKEKKKDALLKNFLWQEYLSLGEENLHKLLRNHPNVSEYGIFNELSLKCYFDIINKLSKPILLQPNRLHFFLDFFKSEYNPKIVHVIRNPLDVYLSIRDVDKTVFINNGRKNKLKYYFGRLIRRIYPSIRIRLGDFEVEKEYNWIVRHIGLPYSKENSWRIKFLHKPSFFEKVVIIWVISNYYAIKSLNRFGGYLLVYEELLSSSNKVYKDLEENLFIKIKKRPHLLSNNSFKFSKRDITQLKKVVSRYNLEEYFQFILQEVRKRNIDYLEEK